MDDIMNYIEESERNERNASTAAAMAGIQSDTNGIENQDNVHSNKQRHVDVPIYDEDPVVPVAPPTVPPTDAYSPQEPYVTPPTYIAPFATSTPVMSTPSDVVIPAATPFSNGAPPPSIADVSLPTTPPSGEFERNREQRDDGIVEAEPTLDDTAISAADVSLPTTPPSRELEQHQEQTDNGIVEAEPTLDDTAISAADVSLPTTPPSGEHEQQHELKDNGIIETEPPRDDVTIEANTLAPLSPPGLELDTEINSNAEEEEEEEDEEMMEVEQVNDEEQVNEVDEEKELEQVVEGVNEVDGVMEVQGETDEENNGSNGNIQTSDDSHCNETKKIDFTSCGINTSNSILDLAFKLHTVSEKYIQKQNNLSASARRSFNLPSTSKYVNQRLLDTPTSLNLKHKLRDRINIANNDIWKILLQADGPDEDSMISDREEDSSRTSVNICSDLPQSSRKRPRETTPHNEEEPLPRFPESSSDYREAIEQFQKDATDIMLNKRIPGMINSKKRQSETILTFSGDEDVIRVKRFNNNVKEYRRCRYNCPQCDYVSDNSSHFHRHIGRTHPKSSCFKCQICIFEMNTEEGMRKHYEAYHHGLAYSGTFGLCKLFEESLKKKGKGHECSTCNTRFSDIKNLRRHIRKIHKEEPRPFQCTLPNCGFSTDRKYRFNDHMATQHGHFQCIHCPFTTEAADGKDLKEHRIRCNKDHGCWLTCNQCHIQFEKNPVDYILHCSQVHNKKMYYCKACGVITRSRKLSTAHGENGCIIERDEYNDEQNPEYIGSDERNMESLIGLSEIEGYEAIMNVIHTSDNKSTPTSTKSTTMNKRLERLAAVAAAVGGGGGGNDVMGAAGAGGRGKDDEMETTTAASLNNEENVDDLKEVPQHEDDTITTEELDEEDEDMPQYLQATESARNHLPSGGEDHEAIRLESPYIRLSRVEESHHASSSHIDKLLNMPALNLKIPIPVQFQPKENRFILPGPTANKSTSKSRRAGSTGGEAKTSLAPLTATVKLEKNVKREFSRDWKIQPRYPKGSNSGSFRCSICNLKFKYRKVFNRHMSFLHPDSSEAIEFNDRNKPLTPTSAHSSPMNARRANLIHLAKKRSNPKPAVPTPQPGRPATVKVMLDNEKPTISCDKWQPLHSTYVRNKLIPIPPAMIPASAPIPILPRPVIPKSLESSTVLDISAQIKMNSMDQWLPKNMKARCYYNDCTFSTSDPWTFRKHTKLEHEDTMKLSAYPCPLCIRPGYKYHRSLETHINSHLRMGYYCEVCAMGFKGGSGSIDFRQHMNDVHNISQLTASIMDYQFMTPAVKCIPNFNDKTVAGTLSNTSLTDMMPNTSPAVFPGLEVTDHSSDVLDLKMPDEENIKKCFDDDDDEEEEEEDEEDYDDVEEIDEDDLEEVIGSIRNLDDTDEQTEEDEEDSELKIQAAMEAEMIMRQEEQQEQVLINNVAVKIEPK